MTLEIGWGVTPRVGHVRGSTRVVVLPGHGGAVKGAPAEFRHLGFAVTTRTDVVSALADVVHDPSALLVIAADLPVDDWEGTIDLAVATCRAGVLIGLAADADVAVLATVLRAGVRGAVDLPLTPDRLARAAGALPHHETPKEVIAVGDLAVDQGRHTIEWRGCRIDAPPREFDVLHLLASNHPNLVPIPDLARVAVHGGSHPAASVRVAVNQLRARLATVAGTGARDVIETVRGVGYRLAL